MFFFEILENNYVVVVVFFIYYDISKYEERSDFDKHLDKKKILR